MLLVHDETVDAIAYPGCGGGAAIGRLDDETAARSFRSCREEAFDNLDKEQLHHLDARRTALLELENQHKISLALIQNEARLLDELAAKASTKSKEQQIETAGCLPAAANIRISRKTPLRSRSFRRQAMFCSIVMSILLLIITMALFPGSLKGGSDGKGADHAKEQHHPVPEAIANKRLETETGVMQTAFSLADQRIQKLINRKRQDRERLTALENDFETTLETIHLLEKGVTKLRVSD